MNSQLNHILTRQRSARLRDAADRTRVTSAVEQIVFRPLTSDDRDGLLALFARLSPQSRYRRFLSPKPRLTSRELAHLVDVDRIHHEAVAAVDPRDGAIVGVGRYVRDRDEPTAAAIALEVADDVQRTGIGTALATWLVRHASANGIVLLTATTLWENGPALALSRRFGFRAGAGQGGVAELELELCAASVPASSSREWMSSFR